MIKQINVYEFDERFYQRGEGEKAEYRPSVTYKLACASPTEWALQYWRGDVGNKRADEIMEESGEIGSYVHDAIHTLLQGGQIASDEIRSKFRPKGALKVLSSLKAFTDWWEATKPELIESEYIIWNDKWNFAGTVDLKCKIKGEIWIVDFKTSKSLHDDHSLQLAAYALADGADRAALLHLGNTTKKGYSWKELDKLGQLQDRFICVSNYFDMTYPDAKPRLNIYPITFNIYGTDKDKKDL